MLNLSNKAGSIYQDLSAIPFLACINVINENIEEVLQWQAKWSYRDITRQSKVCYTTTGSITCEDGELVSIKSPFCSEVTSEKIASISSSKLKACIREIEVKSENHDFLEIWKRLQKLSSIDLTKENKHGIVHANSVFGCLNWSHNSDKLVYVAEKKVPKCKSYLDDFEGSGKIGDKFLLKEDWGEQLEGSYHPTLFTYDVHSKEITDFSGCLSGTGSIGYALWSKDDLSLYILAWKSTPFKMGLGYDKNKYSSIYKMDIKGKNLLAVVDEKSCIFSPLITPSCTQLLYLSSIALGPHRQCSRLVGIDLKKNTQKVVIDVVRHQPDFDCFQGLFISEKMLENCWLSSGHHLVISSFHRSHKALLCVDINNGQVNLLETEGSWEVLCVENDVLFVSFSTPNTPAVLRIGKFNHNKIRWQDVDVPVPKLEGISWEVLIHQPQIKNHDFPGLVFESVLVKPSDLSGLIVFPHGGPHSSFHTAFDMFTTAFCKLGFAVLRVNYRGSLGFGQNSIESILGNIGCQDVHDVQQAAKMVADYLCISPQKAFLLGGSHGGYLVLHLVGQYPEFYGAGAVRNPVTNLVSYSGATNALDWCYVETGLDFSYDKIPTPEDILKFLQCSPVVHLEKVQAPLLFMLGLADLNVPPSQSFEYVHALQGLGKNVKVLAYPNTGHSISCVQAEADCFVNIVKWFCEHQVRSNGLHSKTST